MVDYSALERALTYSKIQPNDIAVFILRGAIESFLASQKAYSTSTPSKPSPALPDTSDLVKRWNQIPGKYNHGCPACGQIGAHYCIGRRGGSTGIEYWYNQPTALINKTPICGGIGSTVGQAMG